MNTYFNLGLFFVLLGGAWWLFTLGAVLIELTGAYIKNRPAVKSSYLRFMLKSRASLYSDRARQYRDAGLDQADALTAGHLADLAIGLFYALVTFIFWPVTVIVLTLRTLRLYHTNEEFQTRISALLKRNPKEEVHYDL